MLDDNTYKLLKSKTATIKGEFLDDHILIFSDINIDSYEVEILVERVLPLEDKSYMLFKYDVDYFQDNVGECMTEVRDYCLAILNREE